MSVLRASSIIGLALLLAACSIGKPVPQATTYTLAIAPPAATPAPPLRQTLRVGRMRVVAAYAAAALVYRTSEVRVIADPYNHLVAEPGPLLADKVADWLEQGGVFMSVAHPESSRPADYVLEGTVTDLYGDFRQQRKPAAVVAIQFSLIDETGTRPRSVLARRIARTVDLPDNSPEALVGGYGEALAEILTELTSDLRAFYSHQ